MPLPPIAVACISALVIDATSNVTAQRLKAWNESKPFVFDRVLFFQFVFMALIAGPINFWWQNWLERTFPGWKIIKERAGPNAGEEENGLMLKEDGEDKRVVEREVRVRSWLNIFKKWFTDCITMGALLNQSLFLLLMGIMKGKTVALIEQDVKNELLGLIWDSYKVWPIANFFSTTYCPVERRIIFLSFCGLLWNIYLSLVAARL